VSFTTDLLRGLAQFLNDQGIGVVYKPDGGYVAGDTGVFFKGLPTSPNRVVAISAYGATDEAKIALSHLRVQFWFRGNPDDSLDVDDLGDAVFQAMQGLEHQTFGTAHVVQALRVSSVQLGIDGSKRSERTDNYALDVNVPTTTGRPD
jgi:hypothetical protein